MWRQLSKASTPLDYPTNHQSFCNSWEDESACWITSRACWCLFFYSPSRVAPGWDLSRPSRHPLCAIAQSRPYPSSDWQRQVLKPFWRLKGSNCMPRWSLYRSVCLSVSYQVWGLCICFVLWTLVFTCRDSRRGWTTPHRAMAVGLACMHACCSHFC